MNKKTPPTLADRRDRRFNINLHSKTRQGLFRKTQHNQIINLSQSGLGILSKQPLATNISINLGEKGNTIQLQKKWCKAVIDSDTFISGWVTKHKKDQDIIHSFFSEKTQNEIVNERRKINRRENIIPHTQEQRKQYRRLFDQIANFSPLMAHPNIIYRRSIWERRQIQRRVWENDALLNKRKKREGRRKDLRRIDFPGFRNRKASIIQSIINIFLGLRDLLILVLPSPITKKVLGNRTFAFITHPRDIRDISLQYPFAKYLPNSLINYWLKIQWPIIGAEIKGLKDSSGNIHKGWLVFCPLTAKQMIKDRTFANKKVLQAIRFSEKINARIVGLGAFTSIVSKDGLELNKKTNIGITTGNALSAATAVQNVVKAANLLKLDLASTTLAIVGAAGNVGSACARNFCGNVKKLILVDINKRALSSLCQEFNMDDGEIIQTSSIEDVKKADIVIAVTNSPGAIVKSEHLKQGAAIIDCAQPKNVSEKIPQERNDVIVIESAILKVPGIECDFDLGIGPEEALGCMAETIVLDAVSWHKDFSIGKLTKLHTDHIMAAAKKLGLDIAYFRHSKGFIKEKDLSIVEKSRKIDQINIELKIQG